MTSCIICHNTTYKLKLIVDNFKVVKCAQCGLVYLLNPLPPINDTNTYDDYFERSSMSPYKKDSPDSIMSTLWQMNQQRLQWIGQIKPTGSILDIGSARGYFLHHASSWGYQVEGVDISPLAAQYCEQQYNLKTMIQNVEHELNISRQYDVITMWHVLEHFSNPLRVLINLKQLLAKDGVIFIEVPNFNSVKFLLSPKGKKWKGGNHPRHHRFFFTAHTLSLLLSKAKFKNIKIMKTVYYLTRQNKIKRFIKKRLKLLDLDSFIDVRASHNT